MPEFDVEKLRDDFPLIKHHEGKLSFLDSAASSQKPRQVIERIKEYYSYEHANIHRGMYALSEKATQTFEKARINVSQFIGAKDPREVIFTRGCTEAINLLAHSLEHVLRNHKAPKPEIILSVAEHHANIVPWQMLAKRIPITLHFVPITHDGTIDMQALKDCLNENTALVSLTHVSNVLGTINPVKDVIKLSQEAGCYVILDGAQATPHLAVNVEELGVDFYAFSSHKMCGPTGVGVLWGKHTLLEALPPYHGGGDMIERVSVEGFSVADLPHKFEAGTPNIAGVLGLDTAINYLTHLDRLAILNHDCKLANHLLSALADFKHIHTYPPPTHSHLHSFKEASWVGIVSFYHKKIHAHDLTCFMDTHGIALRAGHHCAMPLHDYLKASSTLRASPYLYNNHDDIERLVKALHAAEKMFL